MPEPPETEIGQAYTCAVCHGEFRRTTSHQEAMAEMVAVTGQPHPGETIEIVCDDCYRRFRQWLDSLPADERARMERERAAEFEKRT
jgi:ribulose kinase